MMNDHSQTDEEQIHSNYKDTLIGENDNVHDDSKTDFNKKSIDDDCDRDVQLEDTNVEINNVNDDNTGMRSEGEDEIMEENEVSMEQDYLSTIERPKNYPLKLEGVPETKNLDKQSKFRQ